MTYQKNVAGHPSMINAKALTAPHFTLAQEIIKLIGRPVISRKELKSAHLELRQKLASPYFIAKNVALQVQGQAGKYDLSRAKLMASAKKAAAQLPAPAETTTESTPATSAKKEAKPKKEKMLRLTSRAKSPKRAKIENAAAAEEALDHAQADAENEGMPAL